MPIISTEFFIIAKRRAVITLARRFDFYDALGLNIVMLYFVNFLSKIVKYPPSIPTENIKLSVNILLICAAWRSAYRHFRRFVETFARCYDHIAAVKWEDLKLCLFVFFFLSKLSFPIFLWFYFTIKLMAIATFLRNLILTKSLRHIALPWAIFPVCISVSFELLFAVSASMRVHSLSVDFFRVSRPPCVSALVAAE